MAADEPVAPLPSAEAVAPPAASLEPASSASAPVAAVAEVGPPPPAPAKRPRPGWTAGDFMVMAAAIGVLALSIAGLVWLLRG